MFGLEYNEIELLRGLIGLENLRLHALNMSVEWEKSALVPDLSIAIGPFEWLILSSEVGYRAKAGHEFNHLSVTASDSPKGAKYIEDAQGHKVLDRFVGHISIGRPNRVDRVEVLRFHDEIDGDPIPETDAGLVIGFEDGRRVGLILDHAPASLMHFTMDDLSIDELIQRSSSKINVSG